MLVYLEWHPGDGLPAPEVGGVSRVAVVAERTAWLPAGSSRALPSDRGDGPTDNGGPPDVVGTVVWRGEDHPDPRGERVDLARFGFVVQAADGFVLARLALSPAADPTEDTRASRFDAEWSRRTPTTPPLGAVVVLPAAELTVDPGSRWSEIREFDSTAPAGPVDYRVHRVRPGRNDRAGGLLLDVTQVSSPSE